MTEQTSVFICYKKIVTAEDHRGQMVRRDDSRAEILHEILDATGGYRAWRDDSNLPAGIEWEREIYRQLASSDVLLVLITGGTSESEWVKRELALAQAFGISILPLGYGIDDERMKIEVERLGISSLQFRLTGNIRLSDRTALLAEIGPALANARARTQSNRKKVLDQLIAASRIRKTAAASNQRTATFRFRDGPARCRVHIAAGDVSKLRGIDVLVNSENNYMQMARFFERRTVSSILRHAGSRVVRGGVFEDTVQQELDWQLRNMARPVPATTVVPTSAGAPGSVLADYNRARYIFHVAAVQAVDAENRVVPYKQPYQIEACVKNCLAAIHEIGKSDGIISPPDSDQRAVQEKTASDGFRIRSIVFPMFATGEGGTEPVDVIHSMTAGLTEFLCDVENATVVSNLEDVYISVFHDEDVAVVKGALAESFGPPDK